MIASNKGILFVMVLFIVLPSSISMVCGFRATVDTDCKEGECLGICATLSKEVDEYVSDYDLYTIEVTLENFKYRNDWGKGPLFAEIWIYLPVYATVWMHYSSPLEEIRDDEWLKIHWSFSGVLSYVASEWIFRDYSEYSVDIVVAENQTVTAYIYGWVAFYSSYYLYVSKITTEQHWVKVQGPGQPQVEEPSVSPSPPVPAAFMVAPSGIGTMITVTMAAALFVFIVKKRGKEPVKRPVKTPLGVVGLVLIHFAFGTLGIVIGVSSLAFHVFSAPVLLLRGVTLLCTGIGLAMLKTWAWYAAVMFNILSLIERYLLFPTPGDIVIPLEPFILLYLFIKSDVFQI